MELERFDYERIERIKKLMNQLDAEPAGSDWMIVSMALRSFEGDLKQELARRQQREVERNGH